MTIELFCWTCNRNRRFVYDHLYIDTRGGVWKVYRCSVCGQQRKAAAG